MNFYFKCVKLYFSYTTFSERESESIKMCCIIMVVTHYQNNMLYNNMKSVFLCEYSQTCEQRSPKREWHILVFIDRWSIFGGFFVLYNQWRVVRLCSLLMVWSLLWGGLKCRFDCINVTVILKKICTVFFFNLQCRFIYIPVIYMKWHIYILYMSNKLLVIFLYIHVSYMYNVVYLSYILHWHVWNVFY